MTNSLEKKEVQETNVRDMISSDQYKRQFALALPRHIKPEKFIRVALTALTKTPKLQQCTQASLFACLLDCAQMGLEPDGRKAHLIPFENHKTGKVDCTLIVDYKGYVELARRSKEVLDIHCDIVGQNDGFECSFGSEGKLVHKPKIGDRGAITAAYSFVKLKDGSCSYDVMSIAEVDAIRMRSKTYSKKDKVNFGPWATDWAEMAKKTVFRRHSKWLPLSAEFQLAVEKDFDIPIEIGELSTKPVVNMPPEIQPAQVGSAFPAKDLTLVSDFFEPTEEEKAEILRKEQGLS